MGKEQRLEQEKLMINAFAKLEADLSGTYYPLTGMDEAVRQQLVDDHFLLVWVNEEDQLRIISMQKGGDVKGVFERLARGIKAVGDSVKAESGKDFQISPKFGYIHS